MKLSGWILRVSLTAMVLLSLAFTWLIWQNPSRLGHQQAATPVKSVTDTAVGKQTEYLFTPMTAYYVQNNQKLLLFKPDETVAGRLHRTMQHWRLGKVGAKTTLSPTAYATLLKTDQSLQLKYTGSITYRLFAAHFFTHKSKKTPADFTFNRVLITLSGKQPTVALLNDNTRTKRVVTLSRGSADQARQVITGATATSFPVTEKKLNGKWLTYFDHGVKLAPYAFLLDQQNANHFVSLLMPTGQGDNVDSREIGSEVIYTLNDRYRLTWNNEDNVVQYEDTGATNQGKGLTAALTLGYNAITKLNLQGVDTMHYADYDKNTQTVTFRSYAQGLPIFNDVYNGTVQTTNTGTVSSLTFSLNNLTVAIPTTQKTVSLPTTSDMLAQLARVGYSASSVQDIQLGYYWKPQKGNSQVVDLTPTYFVKINNEYKRYTEWLLPSNAAQVNRAAAQLIQ